MMGGMLAGHDQCSGEVIEKNGQKYKLFYGMSSDTAMKKYVGGVAEYRWEKYQEVHQNDWVLKFGKLYSTKDFLILCRMKI